jgi:chemotaxis protein CheX
MKAEIVNPFLTAAISLFKQMFSLEAKPGKPHLVDNFGNHHWEVSGVISFIGSEMGVVVIRLPRVLANQLIKRSGVVFEKESDRSHIINEVIGEITNIIAGNAVGPLAEKGINLDISTPIVIQGKNHKVQWPHKAPIIGLPFSTEAGPFTVNVSMKNIEII